MKRTHSPVSSTRTGLAAITVIALLIGATGCNEEDAEMPDVENRRLDIALSDIERAGFSPDDVEVVGGGMFGVVDESNWQVCTQEPAAGELIGSAPRVVVDRSCEGAEETEAEPEEEAEAEAETEAEAQPVAEEPKDDAPKKRKQKVADTFTMPALVGSNLQDAQDVLQSLGSFLLTQTDATGMSRFQILDSNWKVCFQNPAPGAQVSFIKLVELGAVKLDEQCP